MKISQQLLIKGMAMVLCIHAACQPKQNHEKIQADSEKAQAPQKQKNGEKPGSSYQDTLYFDKPVAVFYAPDSLQLEKIRETTEKWMFDGLMHEYEFQFFYSRKILKRDWAQLEVVESRKARYLSFPDENGTRQLIDIDQFGEPFGLIIYNGRKKAGAIDMPNIEYLLPQFISN